MPHCHSALILWPLITHDACYAQINRELKVMRKTKESGDVPASTTEVVWVPVLFIILKVIAIILIVLAV